MHLASIESLLGSIWFAGLTFMVGYVVAHVFSITKIIAIVRPAAKQD